MSSYFRNKPIYYINDIVPIYNTEAYMWFDWTIRQREWYSPEGDYIYFATRPGHERWFRQEYLRTQMKQYKDSING